MDSLCRSRHACSHRRRPKKCFCHAGWCIGRCYKPRPQTNGGRVQGEERSTDWVDAHIPRPIGTYHAAQACITAAHTRHPHSRLLGQRHNFLVQPILPCERPRCKARRHQLHYSSERGSKFYSHLSDPIRLLQHFAQHRRPFETWSQNSRLSLSARFRDVGASPIQENFLPIFALRTETPLVTRRRHKAKSCDVAPSSADNLENSARQRSLIIRITQVHTASARE
ncbi:hypothetical protein At1D1609_55790 (plasmid) [Agrobacterium tumefaciens]|uniref:Uncharacterized protein n=1 Tax=Agrobacterium tumefaciens TaxID=358 RepID=A0A2L2LMP1_AGRTU|nr:hypothetical protein At1D1609_55790 [Agrobacterium tumefaciens]